MLRVTSIHGGTPSGGGGGSAARGVAAYLTEYYAGAGEEPGVWVGEPARRLALEGRVQREDLVAVLEGRDPRDGSRLGRAFVERVLADGRVVRPVIGFDATFSAPKTVSIMWALTQDPGWTHAHDTAVRAVIDHVQAHAATTRVRTKTGRDYPDTHGLIIATFRQHTSRADDPQLHTHTFISSKVQTADGGWWALDARYLKRYQRALGGLYQTVLRSELTARYGVTWGPVVNGQAELAAVPPELIAQFSKRTNQVDTVLDTKIEAFTTRNGRPPTSYERAALTREAALDSRTAKSGLTQQDLTVEWDAQARGFGWDPARLTQHVTPAGQLRAARQALGSLGAVAVTQSWVTGLGAPGGVFDQLTTHLSTSSTWHRGDVVRAVTDLAVAPAVMAGEQWAQLVESVVDRYLGERCLSLDPPGTSGVVRGSDGRSVRVDPMIGPYTTGAILAQEEQLLTWTLDHTTDRPAPSTTTGRVLDSGTRLDPTQHAAAAAVAGGDPLVLIVGPAGTGKTSTLTAAVTDLEQQGRVVFGVAPSNQAAHVLASETGMRADSVAKLLYEHTRPDRPAGPVWALPAGATLVVDEAGMLPTGDLHQLTQLVDRYRWRLVLVGDPYQLPPVGRGGMFAELLRHTDPVELTVVRRFTAEWEGAASLALRHGDPDVLATYLHHDRIRTGTFDEHTREITDQWLHHTAAGETVAVTAATNDEVERLNTSIQDARVARGDLDPTLAVAGAGGDQFHPGDRVATRRNDRTLTTDRGHIVKNRAQWTIAATDPDTGTITVHGRDGTIRLPADYVAEHVRLAYATTVYGTQGATVDRAVTLVSGATDHRNLYVGATRGRDTNELYVIADSLEDARDVLEQALVRDRVDTPAVTVRRELLEQQEHGRGVAAGARTPAATPHLSGERPGVGTPGEPPMVVATAGTPDARHGHPTPTDPFHGLETVGQALRRLEAERAARQEPREQYQALQNRLHALRREREQLDKPWSPYQTTPLDRWATARHNAQADVGIYKARLDHTGLGHRRGVRRLLEQAQERLAKAEAGWQTVYETEVARLDLLIWKARSALDHTSRPEPVSDHDRALDTQIRDLQLDVNLDNGDRPSLDSLYAARDSLGRGGMEGGTREVIEVLDDEIAVRTVQRRDALVAQQVRRQARPIERDLGPELGF